MIYLANPYSHPKVMIREQRFRAACVAAAQLLASGLTVFSPIVHGHPLVCHGLPTEWPFWERFNRDHLWRCDEVVVLTLDGRRESVGVTAEIEMAGELGKPVRPLALGGPAVSPKLAHVATEAVR